MILDRGVIRSICRRINMQGDFAIALHICMESLRFQMNLQSCKTPGYEAAHRLWQTANAQLPIRLSAAGQREDDSSSPVDPPQPAEQPNQEHRER